MNQVAARTDAVFRRESGRIIASLLRFSGSFDLAPRAWSETGISENPGAWITAVAQKAD